MNRKFVIVLMAIFVIGLFFRIFCGIFVIQPIGAIPEGATIFYWRNGMNMTFISSADGILDKSGAGVSLLGRGLLLAKFAEPIKDREIFRIGYSETIYLYSTDGKKFDR